MEVAVLIIERWLLGRLRHRRFYSLAELNTAIGELLRQLNDERLIRRLGVTRRALFEELDRPNLNSLPAQPYCFAEWRVRRVGVDYHVELEGHFYSVPHRFARSEVEVRLTPRAVEIFLKGERIAAHLRASGNHRHTTVSEHMPSSHRRYADWTVERIRVIAVIVVIAAVAVTQSAPKPRASPSTRSPRRPREGRLLMHEWSRRYGRLTRHSPGFSSGSHPTSPVEEVDSNSRSR